jgi:hypothetical protein
MFDVTVRRSDPEALPRLAGALALIGVLVTVVWVAWAASRLIRFWLWWLVFLLVGGPVPDWSALDLVHPVQIELEVAEVYDAVPAPEREVAGREAWEIAGAAPPKPGPTLAERKAAEEQVRFETPRFGAPIEGVERGAMLALLGVIEGGSLSSPYGTADLLGSASVENLGTIGSLIGTPGSSLGSGGLGARGSGLGGGTAEGLGGLGTRGIAGSGAGYGTLGGVSGAAVKTVRATTSLLAPGETEACTLVVSEEGEVDSRACPRALRDEVLAAVVAAGKKPGRWRVILRGEGPAPTESPE